jgi:glycerol-3-phosphate acyltransferase PlsY
VLPAVAVFVAGAWTTKYISVGSVLATLTLPTVAYVIGSPGPFVASAVAASTLILFRHRSNLVRLWDGTEHRLVVPAARQR